MAEPGSGGLTQAERDTLAAELERMEYRHRVDVTRDGRDPGTRDELNQPVPAGPVPVINDAACHYFTVTKRERVGPDVFATVTEDRVKFAPGTNVAERDRVTEIRLDGVAVTSGRRIERVSLRDYYTEITLAGATAAERGAL